MQMSQTLPNIPDAVIQKLQKLFNLEEGARSVGSFAEAENAAARAHELLLKYNLERYQVESAQVEKKAEIFDQWVDVEEVTGKNESNWVRDLYYYIARHSMCKVWKAENYLHKLWIIGVASNVQLVLYIAEQMISKIRIAEKYAWQEYDKNRSVFQTEKRGTFRRGFYKGAAVGIGNKLAEQSRARGEHDADPYAVMIVSQEKEVDEYFDKKYNQPKTTETTETTTNRKPQKYKPRKGPRQISSSDGLHRGFEAGKKMEINKGVNQSNPKGHIS